MADVKPPTSPVSKEKLDFYPGRIKRVNEFWIDSNQSLELAQRLIPAFSRFIIAMSIVAIVAMLISVSSFWLRPDPLVLLSFPDGTTHCTPPSLNPLNGTIRSRTASQAVTCAALEATNRGDPQS